MTKEEIMEYLKNKDWDKDFLDKISEMIANYVVFQENPSNYRQYSHKYYLDYESAKTDFDNRDYVPSGRWCRCVLRDLTGTKEKEIRTISSSSWE